jgi:uncharacterized protein (DUF1501 family)
VVGGAVKGGKTYGAYPTLALGGPDDVGVDRVGAAGPLDPDQLVSTSTRPRCSRWFGASASQLDAVLPNLVNFGSARTLGFL